MERNIQEEARQYAERVLHRELDAVAKAYIDGYNGAKGIVDDGEMTYIDLGLPSKTLWATKFIGATDDHPEGSRMVYSDAIAYNIPTEEQREELHQLRTRVIGKDAIFYGLNGNKLILPMRGYIERDILNDIPLAFWLKGKEDEWHRVNAVCEYSKGNTNYLESSASPIFAGNLLSVLTVKQAP